MQNVVSVVNLDTGSGISSMDGSRAQLSRVRSPQPTLFSHPSLHHYSQLKPPTCSRLQCGQSCTVSRPQAGYITPRALTLPSIINTSVHSGTFQDGHHSQPPTTNM
ncbi:hypothetical protein QQF64_010960 [Cirrhinus molitorella]|uniref:Uncharacterized protein n=1 Tax=Cirrhinus molitorella TaxID=172907 RepID=A0ABR3M0A5_9TELE